jgi:anti-sigma B factor antagonist
MLRQADKPHPPQSAAEAFAVARTQPDGRTSVIAVEGELDLSTAPQLKWMLIDALDAGHSRLIVDLSATTFMDSTALGVLIGVNRSLEVGARLGIVAANAHVLSVFELSGMDGAFAFFPTLRDALEDAPQPSTPGGVRGEA